MKTRMYTISLFCVLSTFVLGTRNIHPAAASPMSFIHTHPPASPSSSPRMHTSPMSGASVNTASPMSISVPVKSKSPVIASPVVTTPTSSPASKPTQESSNSASLLSLLTDPVVTRAQIRNEPLAETERMAILTRIQQLLDSQNYNIEERDARGYTCLMALPEARVITNSTTELANSTMELAKKLFKHPKCSAALINAYSHTNKKNAVMLSIDHKQDELVCLLLKQSNLNVHHTDHWGQTIAHYAVKWIGPGQQMPAYIAPLLKHPQINWLAVNRQLDTPLHCATMGGNTELCTAVREANPTARTMLNKNGQTPLDVALHHGHSAATIAACT